MSTLFDTRHAAPVLAPCPWCRTLPAAECGFCEGGRYAPVAGDFGPTHSLRARPWTYNPGLRRLTVTRGRKREVYLIREFVPDELPGEGRTRAFRLLKQSDQSVYYLLTTRDAVMCDCAGSSYAASAKANQKAYFDGQRTYVTAGCIHGDAIKVLLAAGLLDLPTNPRGES